jgi:hypothetical protein
MAQSKMPLVFGEPKIWAALLSQMYHVYATLEEVLAKASDPRVAALHRNFFCRMARADAFLCDVRSALRRCRALGALTHASGVSADRLPLAGRALASAASHRRLHKAPN